MLKTLKDFKASNVMWARIVLLILMSPLFELINLKDQSANEKEFLVQTGYQFKQ